MVKRIDKIDKFSDEFFFLSNSYPCEIIYDGKSYKSVEHAYQAAKTTDEFWRKQIRLADTVDQAKRLGKHVPLREDWEKIKLEVMEKLVRQKFVKDMELTFKLAGTGNAELISCNDCDDEDENHLGKILMRMREEIQ